MDASLNSEGGIHFVLDCILLHDEGAGFITYTRLS